MDEGMSRRGREGRGKMRREGGEKFGKAFLFDFILFHLPGSTLYFSFSFLLTLSLSLSLSLWQPWKERGRIGDMEERGESGGERG